MAYQLYITQTAERDIIKAADYIEFSLKNPKAAEDLLNSAFAKIQALAEFLYKSPLVEDSVLSSWGIRFTIIQNYMAFYVVDETNQRVHIVRFLYGKSDWRSILRHGFSLF